MSTRPQIMARPTARHMLITRILIAANAIAAATYLGWLLTPGRADYLPFFVVFLLAELFNLLQAFGYWWTVWAQRWPDAPEESQEIPAGAVDVFITVCDEPEDVVRQTVIAARAMEHEDMRLHVLDDSGGPGMKDLCDELGIDRLTRPDRVGAKAGNINHALGVTDGEFVVIFDADQAPYPEFLTKMLPPLAGERVGFTQSPQWYRNADQNVIAAAANEQQALFYGPILRGKNHLGAAFACGTNIVFRRAALDAIGGLATDSITEDLSTAIELGKAGWTAEYVPEVLAEGLGPEDLGAYSSQQMRWARGGLPILFSKGLLGPGMNLAQRIQYGLSFIYWFTGVAYALYLLVLLGGLFTGLRPFHGVLQYPLFLFPYFVLTLITLNHSADGQFTFRAVWLTLCSFTVHARAIASWLLRRNLGFVVTPKEGAVVTFPGLALPHIVIILVLLVGAFVGFFIVGTPSSVANAVMALGHIVLLAFFVRIAIFGERDILPGTRAGSTHSTRRGSAPVSAAMESGRGVE